jgi:hypothetical protein
MHTSSSTSALPQSDSEFWVLHPIYSFTQPVVTEPLLHGRWGSRGWGWTENTETQLWSLEAEGSFGHCVYSPDSRKVDFAASLYSTRDKGTEWLLEMCLH